MHRSIQNILDRKARQAAAKKRRELPVFNCHVKMSKDHFVFGDPMVVVDTTQFYTLADLQQMGGLPWAGEGAVYTHKYTFSADVPAEVKRLILKGPDQ